MVALEESEQCKDNGLIQCCSFDFASDATTVASLTDGRPLDVANDASGHGHLLPTTCLWPDDFAGDVWTSVAERGSFSSGPSGSDIDGAAGTPLTSTPPSKHNDFPTLKKVVCLDDAIDEPNMLTMRSTKLSAKACLFVPVASLPQDMCLSRESNYRRPDHGPTSSPDQKPLPRDMCLVLKAAHAALCAIPQIFNVRMSDGMLGGATTIVGSYAKGSLQMHEQPARTGALVKSLSLAKVLSIVKRALLDAAAHSKHTYIIGYSAVPFTDVGPSGFSGTIASVPLSQESSTCWDAYQKGYCPWASTCSKCHPADDNTLKVMVMLNEVGNSHENYC